MRPPSLIPEIKVFDFQQSLRFYTDLVGFSVLYQRPEQDFAMLEWCGSRLMLEGLTPKTRSWLMDDIEKPLGRGMHFQIEVPNVSDLYQSFLNVKYPIFLEMEYKDYRVDEETVSHQQFLVQDPNGYLLRFFQRMK